MTTTILAALALSGVLAPAAKPEFQPHTDYASALKLAASEGKPMAVLIGTGAPFARVMSESAMTAEAAALLRDKFVCVAVDVGTAKGAELAGQFQLTDGLVISSAGGTYQALRQPGAVSAADLAKHAGTYATATGTPATTVTAGAPVVSTAAPYAVHAAGHSAPVYAAPVYASPVMRGGCAGGNCGVIQTGYGFPAGGYALPASGGCASGRCSVR